MRIENCINCKYRNNPLNQEPCKTCYIKNLNFNSIQAEKKEKSQEAMLMNKIKVIKAKRKKKLDEYSELFLNEELSKHYEGSKNHALKNEFRAYISKQEEKKKRKQQKLYFKLYHLYLDENKDFYFESDDIFRENTKVIAFSSERYNKCLELLKLIKKHANNYILNKYKEELDINSKKLKKIPCQKCNYKNLKEANFCSQCGNPLKKEE